MDAMFASEKESRAQVMQNEFEQYSGMAREPRSTDILLWWKTNEKKFPVLARMARDYLAMPATSVPCERAFSSSDDVATDDRNRLTPLSITATMCLKSWLRFLKESFPQYTLNLNYTTEVGNEQEQVQMTI
jgi:hypothetical protein